MQSCFRRTDLVDGVNNTCDRSMDTKTLHRTACALAKNCPGLVFYTYTYIYSIENIHFAVSLYLKRYSIFASYENTRCNMSFQIKHLRDIFASDKKCVLYMYIIDLYIYIYIYMCIINCRCNL